MILKGKFGWGIAEGKIWLLGTFSGRHFKVPTRTQTSEEALKEAFARLTSELVREKKDLKKGKEFLDFPLSVLQDPQLWNSIRKFLSQGLAAGQAVMKAFKKWENALKSLDDSYLRLRIHDLEDLRRRLLTLLGDSSEPVPSEPFIAIGKDLYVTDLLRLKHFPLQGVALEEGNESAHGVMLAKALEVPLVGKVRNLLAKARVGELAILSRDKVYIHEKPKGSCRLSVISGQGKDKNETSPCRTKDGTAITVRANLQLPEEIEGAKRSGAMGVGLFRTEFLWMRRKLSVKDESKIYKDVVEAFHPNPVVFRLADFGSDKPYAKAAWPKENNPALGWRGLRFLLDHPEILNQQLQALCAAAESRTLFILLPMVRTREEIDEFLEILKPVQRKARAKIKLGIMIETPSAVDLIDLLPTEVSFLSLGTNDLLQYYFAIDRIHPKLKGNYLDPRFLLLISKIAQKARENKKSISICGEMAGDEKALPFLLGLGLREISVSVPKVTGLREALRRLSLRDAQKRTRKLL